ncbi:MAG: molybdopterin molybdotransferase MoeA, partial [Rhizobiaceae bacterium]
MSGIEQLAQLQSGKVLLNDCFLHDKDRLRHSEAINLLKERLRPIAKTITCELSKASGKILAEDISAPRNVPNYDNSAVDGYAFGYNDYAKNPENFRISQRIPAGDIESRVLASGEAARIFTGAPVPENADTIAMQEDCEDSGEYVAIPPGLKQGANLRRAGEDLQSGEKVISSGTRLRPQDLAAIASLGIAEINVYRPLKIALLSNGNEIRRPGEPLIRGQVYDSNHYLLTALLEAIGVEITDLGILPDEADTVRDAIIEAAKTHDVLISTAGASRGDEDHIIRTITEVGNCHLWQLAIKPGRPMNFGQIGDTIMFGLPGNPVAGFVCFLLYVRPALLRLGGAEWQDAER